VADPATLRSGRSRRWLALLALVLLAHAVALDWVDRQLAQQRSILRTMPEPMLTRLIEPQAPVAPAPAPVHAAAPKAPARPAVTSIARKTTAPRPQRAASAAAEPPPAAPIEHLPAPTVAQDEPAAEPAQASATKPAPAGSEVASSTPAGTATTASAATITATTAGTTESTSAATTATAPQAAASGPTNPAQGLGLDGWPVDTRLSYRLGGLFRHGELHGNARVQWQRIDQRYQTRVDIDITLLVSLTMTSQGEVTPQGLKPEAYEELRRGGPRTARMTEDSVVLGDGRRFPRPPGVQDTASQFVELSHRFSSGRDVLAVGRTVSVWMARPGGVDLWTYDIVGLDRLRTPDFGTVEAFHLIPRPIEKARGNITAEIWFAPSLQYLPVRIKVNMGEETYVDLMVQKIEQQ
jgi:hypothetical protein